MRDLAATRNVVEIHDQMAGVIHEFEYRNPTTTERAKFQAGRYVRLGDQIVDKTWSQCVKYGEAVLTGFKKGTLGVDGRLISSDPRDAEYREDWLEVLAGAVPEILAEVGRLAFLSHEVVRTAALAGLKIVPEALVEGAAAGSLDPENPDVVEILEGTDPLAPSSPGQKTPAPRKRGKRA